MRLISTIVLLFLIFISCKTGRNLPVYDVNYFNKYSLVPDGVPEDNAWVQSVKIKDFILPWDDKTPPNTIFLALYDSNSLYIYYKAEDQNLVFKDTLHNEIDIATEDRVELFLSPDGTMKEYYCLEIDPLGRVLDYKASFYRKFDDVWDLGGIQVASRIDSEGYQIEAAIPLKSLAEMGIGISKDFYVGLFRADFENATWGLKENWLSWVDPKTKKPDFHIPAALGKFHFIENH